MPKKNRGEGVRERDDGDHQSSAALNARLKSQGFIP